MFARRHVPVIALAALFCSLSAVPPTAHGGVVTNPATPAGGVESVTLVEAWRAGGEDDDVFFGSIGRVIAGPDHTVLVMDNQLSQVQVYDQNGEWLRALGREGEGPGEVRGQFDGCYVADGRLCLVQTSPGKLVYLNADGTPGGQADYQPKGEAATFSVLVAARSAPTGILLAGLRFNLGGGPLAKQTFFLSVCDVDGVEQTVYLDKEYAVNFADFRIDEAAMDFVWAGRVAIDDAGRVYTAPERNEYVVRVQDPSGSVVREFSRLVTVPPRTDEERSIATKIHEGIGANYGVPLQGVTVEDTEQAIDGLWIMPGGEVWVQTAANEAPDGAFALLDVFDADGRFTRQVALNLPGDPKRDGLFFLDDGRVALVVGGLDAWLSQQGIESSSEEAPVLEIICFEAM